MTLLPLPIPIKSNHQKVYEEFINVMAGRLKAPMAEAGFEVGLSVPTTRNFWATGAVVGI